MTSRSELSGVVPRMEISLRLTARCEAPALSAHWVEEDGVARIVAPRPVTPAVEALRRWLEGSGFDVVDVRARGRSCRITANGSWSAASNGEALASGG